MAISAYYETIQKIYIAYYGRPADPGGLDAWATALNDVAGDLAAIIGAFATSAEADARFGGLSSDETIIRLYNQLFDRDPESQEIIDAWVFQLENNPNVTAQSIALDLLNGAQNDDAATIANRLEAAQSFTEALPDGALSPYVGTYAANDAAGWLATVSADEASKVVAVDMLPQVVAGLGIPLFIYSEVVGVLEGGESADATLLVGRTGPVHEVETIQYRTQAVTASPDADYVSADTTLTFAPGEVLKQISIPLVDDASSESHEVFNVLFTYGSDGVERVFSAPVTILDDDLEGGDSGETVSGLFDHQMVDGDLFLQNDYLELGVSLAGSLGSINAAPDGFHSLAGGQLSLLYDSNGWETAGGAVSGDASLPGRPEDGFTLGFIENDTQQNFTNVTLLGSNDLSSQTIDTTMGALLSTTTVGSAQGKLAMAQTVELGAGDSFFKTSVTLTNATDTTLSEVRYLRSVDPDQDQFTHSTFDTLNDVLANPANGSHLAIAQAVGPESGIAINFVAFDGDARASNVGFANRDVFDARVFDAPVDRDGERVDEAITLTLDFGELLAGESVTKVFYTALNASGGANLANDLLVGSNAEDSLDGGLGDDMLLGLEGNDVLSGGQGDDLFVFATGDGQDALVDFIAGIGTDDTIDLSAIGAINSFADLESVAVEQGANTLIDFGGGDQITLIGVVPGDLHQDDFLF